MNHEVLKYGDASYLKQRVAGLIDAALCLGLVTAFYMGLPQVADRYLEDFNSTLLVLIVFVVYRLSALIFFKQTLGMRAQRIVLLNDALQPPSFLQRALAALFILFRGAGYYQVKSF